MRQNLLFGRSEGLGRSWFPRFVALLVFWLILEGAKPQGLIIGLPATILATWLTVRLVPLTGGALAKLAAKMPLGYGLAGILATCSAAGTALLMLHFLQRVASTANQKAAKEPPIIPVIAWLATECLCLGLPWVAYPMAGLGSFAAAFAPAIVWKTLWPVLVGVGLFIGLRRWPPRLPSIPSGDIVALGEGVARRSHLRSRDRQTRRHPEVMDCCMPHASSDCPPTGPNNGGWKLISQTY